ncbi:4'-phosphopantetheinyl transferase [Microbispora rosea subsp. aerata]|nr:4'-phosphopantetheinyl transferase superfamily protein [Microbispora rosea]GGO21842.1 4'-phosphopantetheinyl transferase [Microbispora rosea subsp. aerata]GIH53794.1 4'-phosphopantetheinyl transferase [Microbispora rosea subsp. aerata]GLJ81788.1 4'-phosphopantetheinyl transferase [Microbispora rosea subsp. aerata]
MISEILPTWVASAESFGDAPEETLFPEERPLIARAVDRRRREFVTGRHCARLALARIGVAPVPIPRGERGAPVWPAGTVGSITHCSGYRAAAVASTEAGRAVGIDAEPNEPLPEAVLPTIASPGEIGSLRTLSEADSKVCWDRILFSAKESVYKVWFPLTGRWLDFSEAVVDIEPSGTFRARLLVADPAIGTDLLRGRWIVSDGYIATSIALPRP